MSLRYLVRRLIHLLGILLFIMLFTFVILRISPGDPVDLMVSGYDEVTQEDIERMTKQLGLDKPLHTQMLIFLQGVISGDLGDSFYMRRPVHSLIVERVPATMELAFFSMLISLGIGIPVGIIAAVKQGSLIDRFGMAINFTGISLPNFWFGIVLIFIFGSILGLLPTMGRTAYGLRPDHITGFLILDAILTLNGRALMATLRYLILPAVTLGTHFSAITARILRSSMIEVLNQDYINVARSKGMNERKVIYIHALRNALIPMITVVGMEAGVLMTGSLVVETVFSWPGLGRLIIGGIFARDYPLVQAGVIFFALIYVLINLIVDISYGIIDPRIRFE